MVDAQVWKTKSLGLFHTLGNSMTRKETKNKFGFYLKVSHT